MLDTNNCFEKRSYHLKLETTSTKHWVLTCRINYQHEARLLIDTGASHTCLDLSFAQLLRVPLSASDESGHGVNAHFKKYETLLEHFLVGNDYVLEALPVSVLDLGYVNEQFATVGELPVQGIIGNDILEKAAAILDFGRKSLYLHI